MGKKGNGGDKTGLLEPLLLEKAIRVGQICTERSKTIQLCISGYRGGELIDGKVLHLVSTAIRRTL